MFDDVMLHSTEYFLSLYFVIDLECTSSSDGESLIETSSSAQSHERQNIPAGTSLRISTLPAEADSQKVGSNGEDIFDITTYGISLHRGNLCLKVVSHPYKGFSCF
jgi:hypothetical protein